MFVLTSHFQLIVPNSFRVGSLLSLGKLPKVESELEPTWIPLDLFGSHAQVPAKGQVRSLNWLFIQLRLRETTTYKS